MKYLLDSNVWISGFGTRGLCADLVRLALRRHGMGNFELLTCASVRSETLRKLRDRFGVTDEDLRPVQIALAWAAMVPKPVWQPPGDFPDPNDAPIVGAALNAEADALVTGDRPLQAMEPIENLAIITPRVAYERLRRLV